MMPNVPAGPIRFHMNCLPRLAEKYPASPRVSALVIGYGLAATDKGARFRQSLAGHKHLFLNMLQIKDQAKDSP